MQTQITQSSKRIILLFFTIAILFSSEALAQTEIFGFGGYMTYSSIAVREGDLKFDDGPNYGFGLDIGIQRGVFVELNYTHNQTSVRLQRFNGFNEDLFDMNTHYFQIGAQYEFRKGKPWMHEDLIAPFNFAILKSQEELEREKQEVLSGLKPYFRIDDSITAGKRNELEFVTHCTQFFAEVLHCLVVQIGFPVEGR